MGHGGRCWVTDPDSQNFEAGKAATRMAYGKLIVCYVFNFSAITMTSLPYNLGVQFEIDQSTPKIGLMAF